MCIALPRTQHLAGYDACTCKPTPHHHCHASSVLEPSNPLTIPMVSRKEEGHLPEPLSADP